MVFIDTFIHSLLGSSLLVTLGGGLLGGGLLEARAAPYSLFDGRKGGFSKRTAAGIHD